MSDSDRGVPRGDNVPAGEREENEQRSEHAAPASEQRRDAEVKPGNAEGNPRGSAGWGSEPSGGSVIDKR